MGLFGLFRRKEPDIFDAYAQGYKTHENRQEGGVASFKIDEVFSISGKGIVATGTVTDGTIRVGDVVTIDGTPAKVTGIEMFRKTLNEISEGESGGLLLSDADRRYVIPGAVIIRI